MKKKLFFFFLISIHLQSYCQKPSFVSVPCTDSFLLSIKGKYHFEGNSINTSVLDSKTHSPEIIKRGNAIHKAVMEALPQPPGMEANWKTMSGQYRFAHDSEYAKGIHTYHFRYSCLYFDYYCWKKSATVTELHVDGETGNWIVVDVNGGNPGLGGGEMIDSMVLNGQPVYRMRPVVKKWRDYEILHDANGGDSYLLIHRNGVLPYIPVTRKQYFDYRIPYIDKMYDRLLIGALGTIVVRSPEEQETTKKKWLDKIDKDYANNPTKREAARKNYLDSYRPDEFYREQAKEKFLKGKAAMMKRYKDELEKTSREGLLDAPAIISGIIDAEGEIPLFTTEPERGGMLVTENPNYFRKDLPKYVPQLIWLHWNWHDTPAGRNMEKLIEEIIPVEKLQAMIDK